MKAFCSFAKSETDNKATWGHSLERRNPLSQSCWELFKQSRYSLLPFWMVRIKPFRLGGYFIYHNIQHFYLLLTECVYVFCVVRRTSIICLCRIKWLIFCLPRGTSWIFKHNSSYIDTVFFYWTLSIVYKFFKLYNTTFRKPALLPSSGEKHLTCWTP